MRQFASSGFRIWNLSLEAKFVYTGFGIFSILALAVSLLLYEDLVGAKNGVTHYYAGEAQSASDREETGAGDTRRATDGPHLELPADAVPPAKLNVAIPYRKLLEVTHFHLFTIPVFLLILAHLFMLTGLRTGTKAAWIVLAFSSSFLHVAAPWFIRYGGSAFSPLYAASGAAMAISLTVLTLYPIVVMWRRRD